MANVLEKLVGFINTQSLVKLWEDLFPGVEVPLTHTKLFTSNLSAPNQSLRMRDIQLSVLRLEKEILAQGGTTTPGDTLVAFDANTRVYLFSVTAWFEPPIPDETALIERISLHYKNQTATQILKHWNWKK